MEKNGLDYLLEAAIFFGQTVLLLLLISALIYLGYRSYESLIFHSKLSKFKRGNVNVVFVHEQDKYAVPIRVYVGWRNTWMVESVRPELHGNELVFIEGSHEISRVSIPGEERKFSQDYKKIKQVSVPVQELYCELKPKIYTLNRKICELERMEDLTRSSEVYATYADIYVRAISQLKGLITEGEELGHECLKFIREMLIEAEISRFESTFLPDDLIWEGDLQMKYRLIHRHCQALRYEAKALSDLRKDVDSRALTL